MDLTERILVLHQSLGALPHAFGGALALAWCTEDPRGTSDIDVNVFLGVQAADDTLAALPTGVAIGPKQRAQLRRDGQTRVFWEQTPVDLFLNTTRFHEEAATRVVTHPFLGTPLPFLACSDLAVFKAFFSRPKDWVDLADIAAAGRLDILHTAGVLSEFLGAEDPRVARVLALRQVG